MPRRYYQIAGCSIQKNCICSKRYKRESVVNRVFNQFFYPGYSPALCSFAETDRYVWNQILPWT